MYARSYVLIWTLRSCQFIGKCPLTTLEMSFQLKKALQTFLGEHARIPQYPSSGSPCLVPLWIISIPKSHNYCPIIALGIPSYVFILKTDWPLMKTNLTVKVQLRWSPELSRILNTGGRMLLITTRWPGQDPRLTPTALRFIPIWHWQKNQVNKSFFVRNQSTLKCLILLFIVRQRGRAVRTLELVIEDPALPLAGSFLGCPELKSLTMLVK